MGDTPAPPKLNGHVERAQHTPTEEFEVISDSFQLPILNRQLRAWEHITNTVRPHQALSSLTPQPSSFSRSLRKRPPVSLIYRTSTRASPFTADLVILQGCELQLKRRFSVARTCDLCGKGPQFGNNVSHANNITLRRWNPKPPSCPRRHRRRPETRPRLHILPAFGQSGQNLRKVILLVPACEGHSLTKHS